MSDYLEFFHSLNRFGVRPGLERMNALLALLGNPEERLKFIHVAGTNGKGSTCVFIAEILKSAGYKTGLYISPYVVDFRERIQVNSRMISNQTLDEATEEVKSAIFEINEKNIVITEFEAVTAAAMLCFNAEKCDCVVLETGLGGRFDATNAIKNPLACVITSISLDHVKVLGNTLAEIAYEKCGIIKPRRPVITNDSQTDEAMRVITETADERSAPLYVAPTSGAKAESASIFGSCIKYNGIDIDIPLAGEHQIENALTAIKTAEVLKTEGFNIDPAAISRGIKAAKIPARIEILSKKPLIILDGSHNDGATAALAKIIKEYLCEKKLLGLFGMMEDKDCEKNLLNLAPLFSHIIATTPSNPRALPAERLLEMSSHFCSGEAAENPLQAFAKAKSLLDNYDALIICGSFYLAGDIKNLG